MTFGNDGDELDGIFEVSGRTTANLEDFFFFSSFGFNLGGYLGFGGSRQDSCS